MLSESLGHSTPCCQFPLFIAPHVVSVLWSKHDMLSESRGISTSCRQCPLVKAPHFVRVPWSKHPMLSESLGYSTPYCEVLWPRHPMLLVIWSGHPILSESFLLKRLMLSAGEEQPHCCRSRPMYLRTQSVLTQLWNYVPQDPDLWVLTQLWIYVPQDTLSVVFVGPAFWPMYPWPRLLSVVLIQFSDPCTPGPRPLSVVFLDPALWPIYPGPRPLSVALTKFSDPCTQDPDLWVLCWPSSLTSLQLLHTRGLICIWMSSHKHSNKDLSHLQKCSPGMRVNASYINSTRGTSMFPSTYLLGPAANLGILQKSNSQTCIFEQLQGLF